VNPPEHANLQPAVRALLEKVTSAQEWTIVPLPPGGNNRVYRIQTPGAQYFLKAYFQHPGDQRDRLGHEFAFTGFAWSNGICCLPRPLACDRQQNLGLYEFLPGRRLEPAEVTPAHVAQALNFVLGLNRHRHTPAAAALPVAAEACFKLSAHLQMVERRLARLVEAVEQAEAAAFIRGELLPMRERVRQHIVAGAERAGLPLDEELPAGQRCLSPSDFGFHNALLGEDGRLKFIDFEYAGWDDPVKMICDFFSQPAVPPPPVCAAEFTDVLAVDLQLGNALRRRMGLLRPLFQLKWCCIVLNEFLPVGKARRSFAAAGAGDWEARQAVQLQKARAMLAAVVFSSP